MIFDKKILVLAVVSASLLGCATHSDKLGLSGSKDEATMTYAQAYQPARDLLNAGKTDELRKQLLENDKKSDGKTLLTDEEMKDKLVDSSSELAILERALLALNSGDAKRARFFFDAAEEKQGNTEESGIGGSVSSLGKSSLAAVTGAEEIANYDLRGYEKVMLLNYKALTYLLNGDHEKAYNVARRAIDLQQEEHEKFEKELAKLKDDVEEAKTKDADNPQMQALAKEFGLDKIQKQVSNLVGKTISPQTKASAKNVKSAYVNAFGDYMDAMILELDAAGQQGADLGSAQTAYKKAFEINKNCKPAKDGMAAKPIPDGQKVVQVILADGFSPIRQEKQEQLKVGDYVAKLNYANLEMIPSKLNSATVSIGGKSVQMSSLTKLSDLIAKDEVDRAPWRVFMFGTAVAKQVLAGIAAHKAKESAGKLGSFAGQLLGDAVSDMQHPDTRSWMTLPSQILVARLIVPANQEKVTITTRDKTGHILATKSITLKGTDSAVVYASNYDKNLNVVQTEAKKESNS